MARWFTGDGPPGEEGGAGLVGFSRKDWSGQCPLTPALSPTGGEGGLGEILETVTG